MTLLFSYLLDPLLRRGHRCEKCRSVKARHGKEMVPSKVDSCKYMKLGDPSQRQTMNSSLLEMLHQLAGIPAKLVSIERESAMSRC